jgi:hypothetical protein
MPDADGLYRLEPVRVSLNGHLIFCDDGVFRLLDRHIARARDATSNSMFAAPHDQRRYRVAGLSTRADARVRAERATAEQPRAFGAVAAPSGINACLRAAPWGGRNVSG